MCACCFVPSGERTIHVDFVVFVPSGVRKLILRVYIRLVAFFLYVIFENLLVICRFLLRCMLSMHIMDS